MKSTNFTEWMKNTVKSVHYSNNNLMTLAIEKIEKKERLKQNNHRFNFAKS